jgi:hypothetical protein
MSEVRSDRDQVDAAKSRAVLPALKVVVVVGASVAVLVALLQGLLWSVHPLDVTILEVACVALIAVALHSLIPSMAAHESPDRGGPPSLEPPAARLDHPLASPRPGPVTISGVLTGRSGERVSGASVTAIDGSGREVARSRSDASGHFNLGALAAGSYSVVVLAPPFRPMIRSVVLAEGLAIVDVTLHGRGTVSARVLGGRTRRPQTGVPVAMARPGGVIERTTATDSTGRYRFDDVDEGDWVVLGGAPRHRDGEQRVCIRAGELAGEDLVLTALGEVTGEIADGSDLIPGVRVTLVDESGRVIAAARTDRAGTYEFTEVPEGTYAVVALMVEPRTSVAVVSSDTDHSLSVPHQLGNPSSQGPNSSTGISSLSG